MKTNHSIFHPFINCVLARCFLALSLLKESSPDQQGELHEDLNKITTNPIQLLLWTIETICYVLRKINP